MVKKVKMKAFEVEVEKVELVEKKVNNQVVKDKDGKPVMEEIKIVNKIPIVPVQIKKGKGQGGEYLAPKLLSTMTIDDLFKIFNKEEVWTKLLKPKLKQFCATITTEASIDGGRVTASMVKKALTGKKKRIIEEQPIQDEEKFYNSWAKYFSSLSSVGESEAGLTRQQNELLMELLSLDSKKPDYGTRSVALLDEIRRVRESIDEKKADDAEDTGGDSEEEKQSVAA